MTISRREFPGGAALTVLSGGIGTADTAFSIADPTGWSTGGVGNFFVVIDPGLPNEEKIRCSGRTGSLVTVAAGGRGADGSLTGRLHAVGAVVKVIGAALDFDEANKAAFGTLGQVTSKGDLLVGTGAEALTRLAVGADGTVPVASAAAGGGWVTRFLAMTDITGLVSALAAKVGAAFWTAKGMLIAASASGVPVGVAVGADGQVLTADAASAAGIKWATVATAVGLPLASVTVDNTISMGVNVTSFSDTVFTDMDAANLVVTFVAPSSGNVIVEFSALFTSSSWLTVFNVRSGGTDMSTGSMITPGVSVARMTVPIRATGLTPGVSYTFKIGGRSGSGATAGSNSGSISYGGSGTSQPKGPATIVVRAA